MYRALRHNWYNGAFFFWFSEKPSKAFCAPRSMHWSNIYSNGANKCTQLYLNQIYINTMNSYMFWPTMLPQSWVDIAQSLRAGRSGDRVPMWEIFSALMQTGAGAHPASHTMGTGSLPGVERIGRGVFTGRRADWAWRWPPTPHIVPRLKKE